MLEIGLSKVTITPPLGTPLGGYENRHKNATAIHDDVYARCILFYHPENKKYIALIVCDLLWVYYGFTEKVGEHVEKLTGGKVKAGDVILHAIHTHASQRILPGFDFFYKRVKKPHNFQKNWYVEHGVPYLQYTIATSVYGALQNLAPAELWFNSGTTLASQNRRPLNPETPMIEDELYTMVITKGGKLLESENIRGIFYNLGSHCVALGEENYNISADWPYWTNKLLSNTYRLNWDAQTVFTQAAAGNLNPWNCIFDQEVREIRDGKRVGVHVGGEIIGLMQEEKLKPLSVKDTPTTFELVEREIEVPITDPEKIAMFTQLKLWALGVELRGEDLFVKVKLQLLRINQLVLVFIPGEFFTELSHELKSKIRAVSPKLHPIIMELSNGAIGYILPRQTYEKTKGYEAGLCTSAITGEKIIEAVVDMVKMFNS